MHEQTDSGKGGSVLAGIALGALAAAGALWTARRVAPAQPHEVDFEGRAALVTGGSRGLGLLLARRLLEEGARVAICARDRQELARAREDLLGYGPEVRAFECDLTDRSDVQRTIVRTREAFGRIDVLINNAGIIQVGPIETMTEHDFEEAMRVHFWGPLHAILAVLPEMRSRRFGRIVNITSIGGQVSFPHLIPYNASKYALVGLSEGLRAELLKDDVYVTTVVPGLMRTGSPHRALFKGRQSEEFAWFSIADSLPFLSMDADEAADRIMDACRRGEAEIVLTLPAKLAASMRAIFPGATADLLGAVNRWFLPPEEGGARQAREGREIESKASPSWITRESDEAALRNLELAPGDPARERIEQVP